MTVSESSPLPFCWDSELCMELVWVVDCIVDTFRTIITVVNGEREVCVVSNSFVFHSALESREVCGGELTATSSGGTILSPGFANGSYYEGDICSWYINAPDENQQVKWWLACSCEISKIFEKNVTTKKTYILLSCTKKQSLSSLHETRATNEF